MTTEDEWVSAHTACWARDIDGIAPEALMRACGPDGSRIHPFHGPQVRVDVVMRIQRDRADYRAKMAAWDEYRQEHGRIRQEACDKAYREAYEAGLKRYAPQMSYVGAGEPPSGQSLGRDPVIRDRIRTMAREAREEMHAKHNKQFPEMTLPEWEQRVWSKQAKK